MRFDGPTLARAWLAVSAASGGNKDLALFYKSVAVEEHLGGVRLVATDGRLMLTAWVPDLRHHYDSIPDRHRATEQTVILVDTDGRGSSLMRYVLTLAGKDTEKGDVPGGFEVQIDFNTTLPAGAEQPLEGLELTYATLSVPDTERVHLAVLAMAYPDWRKSLESHRPFDGPTLATLDPEVLGRLAKIKRYAVGSIRWDFGKGASADLIWWPDSDPHVHGAVAPLRDPKNPEADPAQATIDEASGGSTVATAGDEPSQDTGWLDEVLGAAVELHEKIQGIDTVVRDACELVVVAQFVSPAMIQRKLRVGFARAREIIDTLEGAGIVGPTNPNGSREVLFRSDKVDQAIAALAEADR